MSESHRSASVDAALVAAYFRPSERGGRALYARAFRRSRSMLLASLRRVGR